jgi:uncharacterized membrane protein (UPF0136 family)
MNALVIGAIAYGILAILGGILGYQSAGSKMSLISGVVSGLLLLLGAFLSFQGFAAGRYLSIAVTGLLLVVFGIRLAKTRKAMPAGVMLICGIVALVVMQFA